VARVRFAPLPVRCARAALIRDPALDLGPARADCSWYINEAWFRDGTVIDFCVQKLRIRTEASPTTVSAYLVGIYTGAAALTLLLGYALLLLRARGALSHGAARARLSCCLSR